MSRRLKEATKYVARGWIPASKLAHLKLLERLNREEPLHFDELRTQFQTDFSLYAQLLRKMDGFGGTDSPARNPTEFIKDLSREQLLSVVAVQPTDLSSHDLTGVKDVQLARMKHSVISCSTVSLLAKASDVDPDFAYTCALIRQLGHLLISWNYPGSCVRAAVNACTTGRSYEDELKDIVGFEPLDLGIESTIPWCENPDILFSLGRFNSEKGKSVAISTQANQINQFCKLGETLAQVNDPQTYPNALKDWKNSGDELKNILGPKGTQLVREKIEELFPHYVTMAPSLFPVDLSPDRAAKSANGVYAKKLLESNQYVRRCGDDVKALFEGVYNKVLQTEASMEALSQLIGKVIPAAGFISGCVYLLDPGRMILVPKLKIGDTKDRTFKSVSCSCGGQRSHPVSEAFHCSTPLKEEHVILNGDVVSHVTGKFGNGDKIGILYLEFKENPEKMIDSDSRLLYFKAIRHALSDCLNLR